MMAAALPRSVAATLKPIAFAGRRDLANLVRYGYKAPKWCQRIWVEPSLIQRHIPGFREEVSARMIGGEWDVVAPPLDIHPKMHCCVQHWRDGVSWEDTGIFEHLLERIEIYGSADGCRSHDELVARYRHLDEVFETIRRDRRLRTRREMIGWHTIRERGGLRIHVGRGAEPIFGGSGYHRLAIAKVLDLPPVPAQLGIVHPLARRSWRRYVRPTRA